MSVYSGELKSWVDVIVLFDMDPVTPEPSNVFASYETHNYEGYALVIVRKSNNLFDVVEGWHCSCFGLEHQFEPTEDMPYEAVRRMLYHEDWECYMDPKREALEWVHDSMKGAVR